MQDLIKFRCPQCDRRVIAKHKYAGRTTNCPECGELLRVPDTSREQEEDDSGRSPEKTTLEDERALSVLSKAEVAWNSVSDGARHDRHSQTAQRDEKSERLWIRQQIENGCFDTASFDKAEWLIVGPGSESDGQLVILIFWLLVFFVAGVASTLSNLSSVYVGDLIFVTLLMAAGLAGTLFTLYRTRLDAAVSHVVRIAADKTFQMTCAGRQHLDAIEALSNLLDADDERVSVAFREFESNAFSPFWDAIEGAVRALAAFRNSAEEAHSQYSEYVRLGRTGKHTYPALPYDYVERIPDPRQTLHRFAEAVRLGQTNFQFASIWEQRKTREAVQSGFQTWADALAQIQVSVIGAVRISRRG